MRLIDYMRSENLDDAAMADRVGGITEHGIRKLKYGERGPSIEVAIRIDSVSGGKVGLHDWSKAHEAAARSEVQQQTGAAA